MSAGDGDYVRLFKDIDSEANANQISTAFKEIAQRLENGSHTTEGISATARLITILEAFLDSSQSAMKLVKFLPNTVTFHDTLCDVFQVLDSHTQSETKTRPCLVALIQAVAGTMDEDLMKERLDLELLGEADLVKNPKAANQKMIRVKTRLFYKQNKFNLHREESEGYSKLMSELLCRTHTEVASLVNILKALIGCFSLDPNRVIDTILEALENQLDRHDLFIGVLKEFGMDSGNVAQIMGFKFSFYQDTEQNSLGTPVTLFKVCALLIKNGIIKTDQIFPLLSPSNEVLAEKFREEIAAAKAWARNVVSMTPEQYAELERGEPETEESTKKEDNFQKLSLLAALVHVGAWADVLMLLEFIPAPLVMLNGEVNRTMMNTLHYIIDPLYCKNSTVAPLYRKKISTKQKPEGVAYTNQISTFREFQKEVVPVVCLLGPMLHKDPILLGKVVRLCKAYTALKPEEKKDQNIDGLQFDILTLMDDALLPSLQLLPGNCCVSEELWCVIKSYPYEQRYRLYASWKLESPHPLLIRQRAITTRRSRHIMKRLSKETAKQCGRQIAKLAHCSPCHVLGYMLSQAQIWDNLIGPVVDSLKFLTSLSYDCLAFCIVEALATQNKDRFRDDGVTVSGWLRSIASFCGTVFKKYNIDLCGLLALLANQIKAEKFLDLLVLKEIVYKMSGIECMQQPTHDQLDAMYGGEVLRSEAGYFTQVKNVKKSSQRLKDALVQLDLAVPLCLLVAQQKEYILYKIDDAHIKLLGKMYDLCQEVLFQFGQFFLVNYSSSEHRLPTVGELLSKHGVTADVAFFLARPGLMETIENKFQEMKKQPSTEAISKQAESKMYVDAVNAVLGPLSDAIKPMYPPKCWQDLSSELYVAFWTLSMSDVVVPTEAYEREIKKLRLQVANLEENKELAPAKKKKDRERCAALIDKLQDEVQRQEEHVVHVMTRLRQDKDSWFISHTLKNDTITQFLQLCLFPRCRFSPMDAVYCAHFVHTLHKLKTQNFSTLICFDKIFCDITYTVALCTESEAYYYGLFLGTLLDVMMRWHADKETFNQECAQYPGFVTRFKGAQGDNSHRDNDVDYENYRHVCHKWHYKLTKALVICLESDNDVQLKNGLIVLTKLIPHFPKISNLYQALDKRVEKIKTEERENRKDVFSLASMYSGHLKTIKNQCVPEQDFHQKEAAIVKKVIPANTAAQTNVPNPPAAAPNVPTAATTPTTPNSSVNPVAAPTNITSPAQQPKPLAPRPKEVRKVKPPIRTSEEPLPRPPKPEEPNGNGGADDPRKRSRRKDDREEGEVRERKRGRREDRDKNGLSERSRERGRERSPVDTEDDQRAPKRQYPERSSWPLDGNIRIR